MSEDLSALETPALLERLPVLRAELARGPVLKVRNFADPELVPLLEKAPCPDEAASALAACRGAPRD